MASQKQKTSQKNVKNNTMDWHGGGGGGGGFGLAGERMPIAFLTKNSAQYLSLQYSLSHPNLLLSVVARIKRTYSGGAAET